jgi:hypothetical protein
MSSTPARGEPATETPRARTVDMKLDVVVIPVSDVARAAEFYGRLGWRRDADTVTVTVGCSEERSGHIAGRYPQVAALHRSDPW